MKRLTATSIILLSLLTACGIEKENAPLDNSIPDTTEEVNAEVIDESEYNQISININYGNEGEFYATNTNAETLGEQIDIENETSKFIELKESNGERFIHSYKGYTNNKNGEWLVLKENEEESLVIEDSVDNIELNEGDEFRIIYNEKDIED